MIDPRAPFAEGDVPGETAAAALPLNASRRQAMRNILTNYFALAASLVTSFLLAPVLLHGLGVGTFGVYGVLQDAALYLGVLEAGMGTATVQRVAHLDALGDREQLRDVIASAKAFFFVMSLLTTALIAALVPFVGDLLQLGPVGLRPAQLALVLTGVTTVSTFFTIAGSAVLYGGGRSDRLGLLTTATSTLMRLIQIFVALAGGGLVAVLAVAAVVNVLTPLAINRVAARTFPDLQTSMRSARWTVLSAMLRSGRRNAAIGIGGALTFGFDALVVGLIRPIAQVAPYTLAFSVTSVAQSIATAGTDMLSPNLAHSYATGDLALTYRVYRVGLFVSLALFAPIAVALIVFGHPLLTLWLGHVPPKTYEVMVVLVVTYVLQLPGNQSFILLTAIDRNKAVARVAVFLGLANLALSVVGTYRYGPVGPALGSFVEVVAVETFFFPLIVVKTLDGERRPLLTDVAVPVLVEVAVAAGVAIGLRLALRGASPILSAPAAALTVVVSLVAAVAAVRNQHPELDQIRTRFRRRLRAARRRP